MIFSSAKAGADAKAHAATVQAAIVFQRAPWRAPTFLVILSSLSRSALVIRFARDDDQRDEAMSWLGRWQTPIAIIWGYRSPRLQRVRRELRGTDPRSESLSTSAKERNDGRPVPTGTEASRGRRTGGTRENGGNLSATACAERALAKAGVAGSLGVMSRRLGPSAVGQAARGKPRSHSRCEAPLRAFQGRRSALNPHIGGQARISTGFAQYSSRAIREPEPNHGNKGDRSNVVAEKQEP
jgi:hypothetical protein